jgi:hypothetical protein
MFGGKCCIKNGCYCVDPTTGKNGFVTKADGHNDGKCTAKYALAKFNARKAAEAAKKVQDAADAAKKAAENNNLRGVKNLRG